MLPFCEFRQERYNLINQAPSTTKEVRGTSFPFLVYCYAQGQLRP
jgi:hypothetical protein